MKRNMIFTATMGTLTAILIVLLAGCGGSNTSATSSSGTGVTVTSTGTVTGTVIDSTSNDEVQEAVVTIGGKSAISDWVGHYEIDDVPAGRNQVTVTCGGYLDYSGTINVGADTTTTNDISITPPTEEAGTVCDGITGAPIQGVTVTLGTVSTTTGEKGSYVLQGIPGGVQTITVSISGYNSGAAITNIPSDKTGTQNFTMYPTGSKGGLQGMVTDAISGMTIANVKCTVMDARDQTGNRGVYSLSGAPSGTQILSATCSGFNDFQSTVEVGYQNANEFNFDMAKPGTTGSVYGNILDMNTGQMLDGVQVTIGSKTTTTAQGGKYSITYVPVENNVITASKSDYITHSDSIAVEPDKQNGKYMAISRTPLRKGPYLLYGNNNGTMTVKWQTYKTPGQAKLEWGPDTGYGHSAIVTENGSGLNEHQFSYTIDSLTENTKIYYRLTVDGQIATGSFKTAPKSTETNLTFYAYGDTRANGPLWGDTNHHDEVCKALMNDMNNNPGSRQSIVLHVGDFSRYGLDEAIWDTNYFMRKYPGQMALESTLPIMGALGNHECYLSNYGGLDYNTGGKLYRKYWPYSMCPLPDRFYYSFDYGPIHCASIDTWMYPEYTAGTLQYDWLKADLQSTTKPWKIVFMHTPAWDCNTYSEEIIYGLSQLLSNNGVKLVLAGHVHHYSRCLVNGITFISTGGGGAQLDHIDHPYNSHTREYVKAAALTYEYVRLDITGNTMKGTVRDIYGNDIDTFDISTGN